MKKYLFLFVSILSIFFITDNVNALSFTASDGKEYIVDSEEKLLDYCYYTFIKDTEYMNYKFSLSKHSSGYYRCIVDNSNGSFIFTGSNFRVYEKGNNNTLTFHQFVFLKSNNNFTYNSEGNTTNPTITEILYSTTDIYNDYNFSSIIFNSNLTFDDIENRYNLPLNKYTITYYLNNEVYKTIEVEEGTSHELLFYDYNDNTHIFSGWQYDENIDLNNITSNIVIKATLEEKDVIPVYIEFPIDKTEFYVLLVEVGVLIMIIFLKWCFPFKGGTDL